MLDDGDVNARVWIRVREVEQSLSLIDQILDRLPDGRDARQACTPGEQAARRHGHRRGLPRRRAGLAAPRAMAGSSAATCATPPGSSGRCSRPRSRATSSPTFRSATSRSTARTRGRISRHDDCTARRSPTLVASGKAAPRTDVQGQRDAQAAVPKPVSFAVHRTGAGAVRRRDRRTRNRVGRAARRRLGRSLSIREVDAGSCNGCELEIHALNNAFYDLERFGLRFVASPRHADVLLVTGPVTKNMREALQRTYDADARPQMGGRGRRLRARRRLFRRQLRRRRRRFRGDAGRPAHSGLPADADRDAAGPAGAARSGRRSGFRLGCGHPAGSRPRGFAATVNQEPMSRRFVLVVVALGLLFPV